MFLVLCLSRRVHPRIISVLRGSLLPQDSQTQSVAVKFPAQPNREFFAANRENWQCGSRRHHIGLWAAATLWLGAHAVFHLWQVAVGICSPSVILRDFPAVTLPAIIGAMLTLWAIRHAHAGRAACAKTRQGSASLLLSRMLQRGSVTSALNDKVVIVTAEAPALAGPRL
jgi:hypothetical protein